MAPDAESSEEWVLLSTATHRTGELSPTYRWYPGYARRDLESAIQADRIELRGQPVGRRPGGAPVLIAEPITPKHELDLIYNALKARRPGPLGAETLFREVEVEWTRLEIYFRTFVVKHLNLGKSAAGGMGSIRGRHEGRDKAIMNRLNTGARPGNDLNWPWKKFWYQIRDDCNGWADKHNNKPKWGFSDRSITRATQALMKKFQAGGGS